MDMLSSDQDYTAFVAVHRVRLANLAYAMCGDWHLAEDLVQVVLSRMYPKWTRIRGSGEPLPYARQALLHALIDDKRRPWRRECLVDRMTDCPSRAAPDDENDALFCALEELPTRQRAVVVMRYLEDLPVEVVAREMGISEGTVKSQSARALAFLRNKLVVHEGISRDQP